MKKGWQTKKLCDLLEVLNGYAFSSKDYSESGHFVMRIGNVQNGYVSLSDPKFINLTDNEKLQRFILSEGDILVSLTGNVGRVGVIEKEHLPAVLNQRVAKITISKGYLATREFLLFFLYSDWFREKLIGAGHGAAQQNVSTKDLVEIELPVPPLPEQQRIFGILDKAFDGIATAKANAEKNLQNARVLFESHLESVFTQRGPGWVEKSVKEIAAPAKGSIRTGPFGSQLLHSEFVDEGIAVLGIDNAVANEFRWGKSRFITKEKYSQLERYRVCPGDVLITIMGTCGRCAIVPDDIPIAINTKHICCITLDRKQCLPGYLHIYFLHAPQSQEFLAKHAKGAIMAGLNMGLIQELPVMLPPIKVQTAIVEAADDLREETQRLESLYQQKLTALEALKKSLLHQAFTGNL